jgi:phosphomannomutase / phosphoglucomutase
MISEKIFREYDIRGIVGKDISSDVAFSIGRAFAVLLKRTRPDARIASVGRDVRLSSAGLAAAVIEGIRTEGINAVDLGICPTPLQYFSIATHELDGGIMITGSHNPPDYNGFKISIGQTTIHGGDIQKLKKIVTNSDWGTSSAKGGLKSLDIIDEYRKYMLNEFSYLAGTQFRRLKVVVDAGNGVAGPVAPELLSAIGCDVIPMYCEPDGNFPNHHPDPTVIENIRDLIAETTNSGADFGVGYDGDADRIGVVNNKGAIVWGDQIMIVLARELLKEHPGAKVIGDVKCSQLFFDDIAKHGGMPVMWKTGHSLIKQKMREEKALLAGEFSGHIFIADRYYGFDDALYTTFRLVEIMKKTGKSIYDLLADIPQLYYTPEIRLDCPDDEKCAVVNRIVSRFMAYNKNGSSKFRVAGIDTTDGVRIMFDNGWGLVRASNTQPVVVMRVEADSEKSLDDYKAFLQKEFEDARLNQ